MSNPDRFTETTRTSFGSRIVSSFVGVLIGFVLIVASVIGLWWNEGRAVTAARALAQGERSVVEANADTVDPSLSGKLVHVTGPLSTGTPVRDATFGVGGADVVRLQRKVEMYQWKETKESHTRKDTVGGGETTETTYSYSKVWSDRPLDSSRYRSATNHQNPSMPFTSRIVNSGAARLGAYRVDSGILAQMDNFAPYAPANATPPNGFRLEGDTFFRGDSGSPKIGDVRVNFAAVTAQTMSVVAALSGNSLAPFHADNGYTIKLATPGVASAVQMLKEQESSERTLTWIIRAVGFVAMAIGFMLILGPLSTLASFLPFLGGLVEAGAFIISMALAIPITLIVIALAWLANRPLLGIGLLVVAAVVFFGLVYRHRHRKMGAASAR